MKAEIGKIIELDDVRSFFGIGEDVCSSVSCSSCLYNNMGEKRQELGETCGVRLIFETVKKVVSNYEEKILGERKNKESIKVITNTEFYF